MVDSRPAGWRRYRSISVALLVATILLLPTALAQVQITNIQIPNTVNEGDLIEIEFEAQDATDLEIYLDDVMVSDISSYSWQTDYADAGNYVFRFVAYGANSSDNQTRILEILDVPLDISIESPINSVYGTGQISVVAKSPQADSCDYEIENTQTGILFQENELFTRDVELDAGVHTLIVSCQNQEDSDSDTVTFEVDGTAPVIENAGPNNGYSNAIQGDTATLNIATNEDSECRYSKISTSYENMDNQFGESNGFSHYELLTNLKEGIHTYYVSCKDEYGNVVEEPEIIEFYTNMRPTASISIEGDEPLEKGRYEVVLISSEPLNSEPILQYKYHDDGGFRSIALTGSDSRWEGYLVIEENVGEVVGDFRYTGKDLQGVEGTEITDGKLFLVDTTAPDSVDSFTVKQSGDSLMLKWHYSGLDEVDVYRIYRSIEPTVLMTDFWGDSKNNSFRDSDVAVGVTYYYKVAVEDEAGNIGSLSKMVSGRVEPELEVEKTLAPSLVAKVQSTINELESYILDSEWSVEELESETDSDKVDIIEKLGLLDKAKATKGNLESIKRNLESLKNLDITEDDLDKRLAKIRTSINLQKDQLIRSVSIDDQLEYRESYDESAFTQDLNQFAELKNYEYTDSFIEQNRLLQEKVDIHTKLSGVDVEYMYSEGTSNTIVRKSLIFMEPLSGLHLVEFIPKGVEENADSILFGVSPNILLKDPVVEWELPQVTSHEMYYVLSEKVGMNSAKNVKSWVFLPPKEDPVDSSNQITGNVAGSSKEDGFSWFVLLIGLLVIGGLATYYFFFMDEENQIRERPMKKRVQSGLKTTKNGNYNDGHIRLIEMAHKKADEMDVNGLVESYKAALHYYNANPNPALASHIRSVYLKILAIKTFADAKKDLKQGLYSEMCEKIAKLGRLRDHIEPNSIFAEHLSSMIKDLEMHALSQGFYK